MESNKIILRITPQTNVRSTDGDKIVFRIPEECPYGCGLPRRRSDSPLVLVATMRKTHKDLWKALGGKKWKPRKPVEEIRYGCPHSLSDNGLKRKRRLERYNEYKANVSALAKVAGFSLPDYGCAIYFYVPMPKRWTPSDRKAMHGQLHHRKVDLSNYLKAFEDSLRGDDERIAQYSGVGKIWIDEPEGYIEILLNQPVYNPFSIEFIDQRKVASLWQTQNYNKKRRENPEAIKKRKKKSQPIREDKILM